MNFIKGNYRSSIYENDTFIIGLFKVTETNIEEMEDFVGKAITFKGNFDSLNHNELYYFYGKCVMHPKYGFQFDVDSYERIKPEDKDGIIEYLSSSMFKGIGKSLAKKIVDTLGENALDKIIEDKTVLYKVPKLNMKKAEMIYNNLIKYEESQTIIVKLNTLGFNMNDSLEIYNFYKGNTLKILEHNPYQIIEDIDNISFPKLDEISTNLQIDKLDSRRIEACIIYIMKELSFKNGDTYSFYDEVVSNLNKYNHTNIDEDLIDNCFNNLASDLKIVIEDDKYYLIDIYDAEVNIASKIKYLVNKERSNHKKIDSYIQELETHNRIIYNDIQKEAIKKAINNNITIITGGPGTGKTTIIKAIIDIYSKIHKLNSEKMEDAILLLAPTGRASKRMMEATNFKAFTIHRFLKWNKEANVFGINEYNPDFHNLIIIDEVSMIDNYLMDNLLKGLSSNIKLVLVGDYNQLPSVGAGNILRDLIDSNIIDTVHLNYLYRQNIDSYIPVLASEIRNNSLSDYLSNKDDYRFIRCNKEGIIKALIETCKLALIKGYDYKKIQVMAPMYAGVNGIDNLNKILQNIFNPKNSTKKEIKYGDVIYREGDKVLQLINLPDENVYNGDIGIIKQILEPFNSGSGKREVVIDFDGNIVHYEQKDLVNIKHGFIMSIHKSQGSEFELVIMTICKSYHRMLYRKLIYTGITRAKRKLILIGSSEAFKYSVENSVEIKRKTDLLNKLNK